MSRRAIGRSGMKANQIIIAFYEEIIKIKNFKKANVSTSNKNKYSNKAKGSGICFSILTSVHFIRCLKRHNFAVELV